MSTAYATEGQSGLEQVAMLLDAYRASELAHRRAADRARSQQEREALLRKAHERARFARELDTELSMLGGTDPDDFRASDRGDGPQAWPRADDDLASLVARTEMRVRSEVERSLGDALPTELQTLLERHARALASRLDGDAGSSVSLRR
jgi:hypothetical protein